MLLQTLIGGFVQGCIYSLIALGFVLIYRYRQINFAQEICSCWVLPRHATAMGSFLARSVTAQPAIAISVWFTATARNTVFFARESRISVILLTLGLGFVLRSLVTMIWGLRPFFPVLMNNCYLRGKRW